MLIQQQEQRAICMLRKMLVSPNGADAPEFIVVRKSGASLMEQYPQ